LTSIATSRPQARVPRTSQRDGIGERHALFHERIGELALVDALQLRELAAAVSRRVSHAAPAFMAVTGTRSFVASATNR